MANQIINLEEHTSQQLGSCVASVYELFQSIRYGRVKEGEILSALIYGGALPPQMVAKIENTLDTLRGNGSGCISGQSEDCLMAVASGFRLTTGQERRWLAGRLENRISSSRGSTDSDDLPRSAENRKSSGKFNENQMELFEWNAPEDALPREIQILHTKEWNAQEKIAKVRVWGIALKESVGLLGPRHVIYYDQIGGRSAGPVEQALGRFLDQRKRSF